MTAAVPAIAARRPPATHPHGRRLRISIVLLVVALFAVGLVVGGYTVGSLVPPRVDPTLRGLLRVDAPGTAVFDRRQRPADLVAAPPGREFERGSLRRLLYLGSAASTLFAARDLRHRVCLIATQSAGTPYAASCAPAATAGTTGIRLKWSLTTWAAEQPIGDNGYLPRFVTAVWGQDGSVRLQVNVQGQSS